jgi:hypothetical protein
MYIYVLRNVLALYQKICCQPGKLKSLCHSSCMCKDTKLLEPVTECSRIRVERNHIRWIEAGPVSVESARHSPKQVALKTAGRDVLLHCQ